MTIYLDSSAIVKLVQREAESRALRRYLASHGDEPRVTSALARVEVVRAVSAGGAGAVGHARRQLARLHQVAIHADLLDRAASLVSPARLRSLDAIHLASADLVGARLRAVVTYDLRMAEAGLALGLPVEAPT